ncbi:MAG TPA: hypothetical protein VK726_19075 [Acetobacteraceae bacterium]|nr:hypothetical protein [Acetobacteraceae bacterium]
MNDILHLDADRRDPRPEGAMEEAHRVRPGVTAATPTDVPTRLATAPSVRCCRRAGAHLSADDRGHALAD